MESVQNQPQAQETKPAGYKVESVILLETTFWRDNRADIIFSNAIHPTIELLPEAHETAPDGKFAVALTLKYSGHQEEIEICKADIKMIGVFEKYGEPQLSDDKFKAVNAPAIIYPFIREHLHNICLRAGIANVLLPTINFKP